MANFMRLIIVIIYSFILITNSPEADAGNIFRNCGQTIADIFRRPTTSEFAWQGERMTADEWGFYWKDMGIRQRALFRQTQGTPIEEIDWLRFQNLVMTRQIDMPEGQFVRPITDKDNELISISKQNQYREVGRFQLNACDKSFEGSPYLGSRRWLYGTDKAFVSTITQGLQSGIVAGTIQEFEFSHVHPKRELMVKTANISFAMRTPLGPEDMALGAKWSEATGARIHIRAITFNGYVYEALFHRGKLISPTSPFNP